MRAAHGTNSVMTRGRSSAGSSRSRPPGLNSGVTSSASSGSSRSSHPSHRCALPAAACSAVMRERNWVMGLAVPIVAAIVVGIAVVVISGGGGSGGDGPSALAAGFPPARLAGASFTGAGGTSRVTLDRDRRVRGRTEVAAGGVNGGPALWVLARRRERLDARGARRACVDDRGGYRRARRGRPRQRPAGWPSARRSRGRRPLVVSSPNARTWTVTGGLAGAQRGRGGGRGGPRRLRDRRPPVGRRRKRGRRRLVRARPDRVAHRHRYRARQAGARRAAR